MMIEMICTMNIDENMRTRYKQMQNEKISPKTSGPNRLNHKSWLRIIKIRYKIMIDKDDDSRRKRS